MQLNDWRGKSVFITGHTGFKGSWLCMLLAKLGAKIHGFALEPLDQLSLFKEANIQELLCSHEIGDIRDEEQLIKALRKAEPDVVFHLAAQPLVRESYRSPSATFSSNVMGTVSVLEAVRLCDSVRSVVCITTDKVYQNKEWMWPYREHERLGGHDPYSASKACAELVIDSYRRSFFHKLDCRIAAARAGNIIGGGDWSKDRLIPDIVRAIQDSQGLSIRYPEAIRPWQHVLEPLLGYMALAQALSDRSPGANDAYNFGPKEIDCVSVRKLCERARQYFGTRLRVTYAPNPDALHEAHFLKLDSTKAKIYLNWETRLPLESALAITFKWYDGYASGRSAFELSMADIEYYFQLI